MELKDFIKNAIASINDAIVESQQEFNDKNIIVNPEGVIIGKNGEKRLDKGGGRYLQKLEFDVLVSAEDQNQVEGKAGLSVSGVFNVGGKKKEAKIDQNQNRIKFVIPVAFSTSQTPEKYTSFFVV